jgi:hypothetical protein
METRAYPFKRSRLAAFMVFLVTFVAALLCLVAPAFPQHVWLIRIGSGLAILLFGGVTVFVAGRLFSRTPGLVIDNEGIMDNFRLLERRPHSLERDRRRADRATSQVPQQPVRPRHPGASLPGHRGARPTALHRSRECGETLVLRANAAGLGSPVAISPASVHVDTDELAQYIRRIVGAS